MIEKLHASWRRELLYVGLAAMECCWLYPWQTALLGARGQPQRIPWAVQFGTLLAASYITRIPSWRSISLLAQRVATVGLALASGLVVLKLYAFSEYSTSSLAWLLRFVAEVGNVLQIVPVSLITFLSVLYLWWRGVELAQRSLSVGSVGFSFRWGIIALFWLFIAGLFLSTPDAIPFAFLYFLLGLLVVGLARVEEVSSSLTGIRSPFNSSWMAILVGSTLVVSALSLVAVRVFSLRNVASVALTLRPFFAWIARAARPLLALLAVVLELLLNFLIQTFRGVLGGSESATDSGLGNFLQFLDDLRAAPSSPGVPFLWKVIQWVILGLALTLVLAVLALSVGRIRRALDQGRSAEHDTVWDSEEALRGTKSSVREHWRQLRERMQARLARWRGESYSLASIRRTYASLVRLASGAGFPRHEAQTPYEYVGSLQQAFPESAPEIQMITEAYVRVHYGQRTFRPQYVQQVRDAYLSILARQQAQHGVAAPPDREN